MRQCRGAADGSFGNRERGVRGRDHRRNVLGDAAGLARMARVLEAKPLNAELPAQRDQGLGTRICERADRPLDGSADGRTGRGWAGVAVPRQALAEWHACLSRAWATEHHFASTTWGGARCTIW